MYAAEVTCANNEFQIVVQKTLGKALLPQGGFQGYEHH